MLRHKRGNLCARLLLAVVFLTVSTVGFLPEMSRADHAPQDTAVVMSPAGTLSSPSALLSGIPQEFGTIQNMDEALPLFSEFKSDQLPWVIHIQDAHSNPSVQTNMLGILEYLSRGTADLYVGVEGAAGPLHPEYFDIFPGHPSAGDAIIDDLLAKGELSGVERFAWNQYRQKAGHKPVSGNRDSESLPGASVFGIENLDYYRDNLRTFRTLLSAGGAIQDALDRKIGRASCRERV